MSLLRVDVEVDHELGVVVAELDDDDRGRNRTAIFFSFWSSLLAEDGFLHFLCFSSVASSSICFPPQRWSGGCYSRQARMAPISPAAAAAMDIFRGIITGGPLHSATIHARESEMLVKRHDVYVLPCFARRV